MKCIIIEDEDHAASYLEKLLSESGKDIVVQAKIDTVEGAVSWLKDNTTDLIFLDIQLGDGLSFEIFDHIQVKVPIIFTTSYEKYVIKSFEQNSLAYLLKPIKNTELMRALDKYDLLYSEKEPVNDRIVDLNKDHQKRFLVRTGGNIQSVAAEHISYFHLQNKRFLFINTKDKQQFLYDSTMEFLEKRLDPGMFFRVNRQFTINFNSIANMHPHERGRVKIELDIPCKEEIVVSINKAAAFKKWLDR